MKDKLLRCLLSAGILATIAGTAMANGGVIDGNGLQSSPTGTSTAASSVTTICRSDTGIVNSPSH